MQKPDTTLVPGVSPHLSLKKACSAAVESTIRLARLTARKTHIKQFIIKLHRSFVFRIAMSKFLKDPKNSILPGSTIIPSLIYGWGNESWSALEEYLRCCIEFALTTNGPILECGSGLSTILIGAIAQKRGYIHYALEHTPIWANKVKKYLGRYKINSVVMYLSPLRNYTDFYWYDPPLESMKGDFSLVICDGPPGNVKGGRYGLVPIIKKRLKPNCIILLDDAEREQEQSIAKRWEKELNAKLENLGSRKPYIKITVGDI